MRLTKHIHLTCEFHHGIFSIFSRAVRQVAVRLEEKLKAGFDLVDKADHRPRREQLIVGDVESKRVETLRVVFKAMLRLQARREEWAVPILVIEA